MQHVEGRTPTGRPHPCLRPRLGPPDPAAAWHQPLAVAAFRRPSTMTMQMSLATPANLGDLIGALVGVAD